MFTYQKLKVPLLFIQMWLMGLMLLLVCKKLPRPLNLYKATRPLAPDGRSVGFLKKFLDKLAPLLLPMYNESLDHGSLPPTLTQESITLLLKKGKDPESSTFYRPLS